MKKIVEMGTKLSRTSQQKIKGGLAEAGTCGTNTYNGNGERVHCMRGLTKAQAQQDAAVANHLNEGTGWVTKWCCESCTGC
jgi:hypothetical protein